MYRNELLEPSTPPGNSRARKNGESSLVSSILDSWICILSIPSFFSRSFDDSKPYISDNKQTGRTRGLPENNLLKSFAADKEKSSSLAKIKVVVRKRPLNKNELAKNELV
ncbi:kinesin-like protein KIN-13B [Alnus glutinosa]|uniref:kinesin-like protein KIN-13B n=1 Tax=Alnus glutinosa TaxID=3517 RepID=UPI002D7692D9|nr:kinesin-like protein KIN-13B [Alnus glutinosa]